MYTWILLTLLTLWKQSCLCSFPLRRKAQSGRVGALFGFIFYKSEPPLVPVICGVQSSVEERWQARCICEQERVEDGPLHRRGVYSHSAQGSAFEVSGIRGPCFSFFPSQQPHPLSSCCGPMHLSRRKYYPASNLACLLPLLFSMSFLLQMFWMLFDFSQTVLLFLETGDTTPGLKA